MIGTENYSIIKIEKGIYYLEGEQRFQIQIIVSQELSIEENLWMRGLTDDLEPFEITNRLIRDYGKHKNNNLYKSVMNMIVRAYKEKFQEAKEMCDELMELMKDELDEATSQPGAADRN